MGVKCAHPTCIMDGSHKIGIVSRWGWDYKLYCDGHLKYARDLQREEKDRIFPDGKVVFWDLFKKRNKHNGEPTVWINPATKIATVRKDGYTLSKREIVYARDGNKCLCCGTTERLTLDHIIPVSLGGKGTIDNLQTLCFTCNGKKDNGVRDYRGVNSAIFASVSETP